MNPYTRGQYWGARLRQWGLTALLVSGAAAAAQAQNLNYSVLNATNTTTTYTDLGTAGTAIATTTTDDANSAAQAIGFSFSYGGTAYTQFVLNTNGFIKLGSTAPSTAAMFIDETSGSSILDPFESNDTNIIAPLNVDLTAGAAGGTEYRVATTGTAGARVCTIQWKNVQDKANVRPTQYTNLSFQVRLYEGTNVIELVYDAATAGSPVSYRFTQAGLKGTGFASGQLVQVAKGENAPWSAATFADFSNVVATNNLNTLNISAAALPDAGRTFRFTPTPPLANDIALRGIYTPGKIASPTALPQAVRVYISNLGTATQTNIPITLTISGANTYTVTATLASLAAGAQGYLTLANLPATLAAGTNTVTASVPNDDNNANNSVSTTQLVTATRLSQIDPSKGYDGAFSGYGNGSTVFATKFILPSTTTTALTDAIVSFGNTGATTAYQVLVYDASGTGSLPGKVLYTSATQNRPAAGGDVTVTLPNIQLTGTFYLGVREAATTGIGLATQSENPLRSTTFYFSADGATGWVDMAASYPRRLGIEVGLAPAPTCATPTALTVTATTPTTATVTFADASNTGSYQLVYGPVGFQPATGGTTVTVTGSPATITGLTPGATYQVYVRSNCTGGGTSFFSTPATFSTGCAAVTTIASFPYSEGFENIATGQTLPCGLTVLDANNDKATWAINKTAPYAGVNALRYTSAINNSVAADDWFFTPALTTAASTRYQLAFRYRGEGIVNSPSNYTEKLEVKVGAAATPAGQTTTLYTNTAITNTSYALANATSTPAVAVFTPGAGTQYVGFHVFSAAEQGNLYIDDLNITASVVTATSSEALLRAVTVFPNPSATGLFDLEIHGAQAKGSLAVRITNALGQQVYTGAARDNYTNRLDLSSLAPGIYHLQVRNGDETMTRQLAIVK
ncbi:T9SS type A sorting domain-containing protein [Hymenobacter cheonanensis]|uniref:T9SS type A sorting domain-containing protein n=1 Tax=Hymenobacter sp. CA2-7 TaxID=3063993 RepID=UPI002713828E|nr:T9SS type A sorting domain-containing protein [Hymenobacter sp. CA2-7]MDO7885287.1 T9SS type A sorting domain-containing protein [Hymenobacter sp. CA2-7]